jgi:hypothetical protein
MAVEQHAQCLLPVASGLLHQFFVGGVWQGILPGFLLPIYWGLPWKLHGNLFLRPGRVAMAEIKTKKTAVSVADFIAAVPNESRRADAQAVLKLMQKVTGKKPKMWGPTIIGFDEYHYQYDSGHEGDMCMIGFSPRGSALVLYVLCADDAEKYLQKLGKHKRGKGCLYVNKLADVDLKVLEQLADSSYRWMLKKYPKQKS